MCKQGCLDHCDGMQYPNSHTKPSGERESVCALFKHCLNALKVIISYFVVKGYIVDSWYIRKLCKLLNLLCVFFKSILVGYLDVFYNYLGIEYIVYKGNVNFFTSKYHPVYLKMYMGSGFAV